MTLPPSTRILYRDDEDRSRRIRATVLEKVTPRSYEIREDGDDYDTPWIHQDLIVQYLGKCGAWHGMDEACYRCAMERERGAGNVVERAEKSNC